MRKHGATYVQFLGEGDAAAAVEALGPFHQRKVESVLHDLWGRGASKCVEFGFNCEQYGRT